MLKAKHYLFYDALSESKTNIYEYHHANLSNFHKQQLASVSCVEF